MSSYNNIWLYAYSSKNKIKMWRAYLQPVDNSSSINIVIEWGYKDQKISRKITTVSKGKNIGKVNETSIQQQAELELKYLYTKQFDSGYVTDINQYQQPISAMLAHKYKDRQHTLVWPDENNFTEETALYVSPKLNGIRLNIFINAEGEIKKYQSRSGKLFKDLSHITRSLKDSISNFKGTPVVLDGELYNHNIPFEILASLINSDDYVEVEVDGKTYKTEDVDFHIYDVIFLEERELPFYKRYKFLIENIVTSGSVKYLENYWIKNYSELQENFKEYISAGYEGLMLRTPTGIYECDKRSNHLLKYKVMEQDEFLIHSIYLAENDSSKVQIICVNKYVEDINSPHRYFNISSLKGNKELNYNKYFLNKNNLENKAYLTVDYQALSEYSVPLFAVGVDVREGVLDENNKFIPSI